MKRILPLALLLAAGCQSGGSGGGNGAAPPPTTGQDILITTELEYSSYPIEGNIGTFEVWIKNVSKNYIILRDLVQPGVGPVMTWQAARSGTLDYSARTDEFEYGSKPSDKPRPAFNVSLMAPGEEIHLRPRIRLLQLPRRYLLNYFVLDRRELEAQVYFEQRAD